MIEQIFQNRRQAGRDLARVLTAYAGRSDVVVLALPRGGVPVGYEVAEALRAPLDVMVVRKLGVPDQEELAMGAIATGHVRVLNRMVVDRLDIDQDTIERVARQEGEELLRRERVFRGQRAPLSVQDRIVILVDDGLATGATMRAAVQAVRQRGPRRIVVAVPTAAPDICDSLRTETDEVYCLTTPTPFFGVGQWYEDFSQTTDEEVRTLLEQAAAVGGRDERR